MKIHFSNVNFTSRSGPNSFAIRLAKQFGNMGHIVADRKDYDIALAFIDASNVDQTKPYVLRLDGIWSKPQDFLWRNVSIKKSYEKASGLVFQSEFNKQQIETWWGPRDCPKAVIHNGINLDKVNPQKSKFFQLKNEYEKVFVCSANWHPQKRLAENIKLYKYIRKHHYPSSCLIVLGDNYQICHVADPYIFYTGSVSHADCLECYSVADWMIHLAWLDHCPNTVVEALSQGCPVICSSDGGTKELVQQSGILIDEMKQYDFTLQDYDNPPAIVTDNISISKELFQYDRAQSKPSLDIEFVANQYLQLIDVVNSEIRKDL